MRGISGRWKGEKKRGVRFLSCLFSSGEGWLLVESRTISLNRVSVLARGKSKDIVVNGPQVPEQTEEEYGAGEDIEYTVEDHFGGRLDYVASLRYTPTDGI